MINSLGGYEVFVGVDVDQKSYAFTVRDDQGMKHSYKIPAQPQNLYKHIRDRYEGKRVLCAYEVGGTGYHLYDYLKDRDIPCLMVSPPSMPKASNDKVKNNRLDSEKIAQHLKTGTLPSIRVPDPLYRELRHLIHTREDYVSMGRVAKQRIKALLLYSHQNVQDPAKNWSARHIQEIRELNCSPATRQRLDLLLEDLTYARKQNLKVIKELKGFIRSNPSVEKNVGHLRSIPGIGFTTAITLLANIGNPKELKHVNELGAFMGLVPSEYSTGERVSRGSITHIGNRTLRGLMVEAAWTTIRRDKRLEQFYHRIRVRHPVGQGQQKAIVAVARKLSMIVYRVLKDQRDYIAF